MELIDSKSKRDTVQWTCYERFTLMNTNIPTFFNSVTVAAWLISRRNKKVPILQLSPRREFAIHTTRLSSHPPFVSYTS